MKKNLIKFSAILVILCILCNCQSLTNSTFNSEIALDDFEKNGDKDLEEQSLEFAYLSNQLNFSEIEITNISSKKIFSNKQFAPSLNTPPPNFYS